MLQRFYYLMTILLAMPCATSMAVDKTTYQDDVQPILREHCFACHNQDDVTAGLALDSFEGLTAGGASGEVLAAGDPDASRLWQLVTHQEEPNMPPGDQLPEQALQVIRAWIEGGLLQDADAQPLKRRPLAIARLDAGKLGKLVGEPAMPEQLFHESVLWRPRVGPINALATSPWAPLAAIAWQRQISFYDTNTEQLLGILPYIDGVPQVVRFSRDGSLILVAGGQHGATGNAALFDVKTGVRLATLGDELDVVLAADISPDHALVALGGPKKTVRVYHVADGSLAYQLKKHTAWITTLSFSPDGRLLATADRNGIALLWQAAAGHERAELRGHQLSITSLDWRGDAAMLATASEDGTARLWNRAGSLVKSVEAHKNGVLSIRFSRDGNLVTAGRDRTVRTWNSDGGAVADLGKLPGMALAAAYSHDGSQVLASDYTGQVRLIDVASRKQVATLPANPPLLAQRLGRAEKLLRQAAKQLQADESRLKSQLAALEQGREAWKAHESRLAQARTLLTAARQHRDDFAEARADDQQEVAATGQPPAPAAPAPLVPELPAPEFPATEAQQEAEESVRNAEAILAQAVAEAAGRVDLAQLAEQYQLAQTEVVAARHRLQQARLRKTEIASQQARYTQAAEQFASQSEARQSQYQELAKESEQAALAHQQAASQLARHRPQLAAVAKRLQTIQDQLVKLESTETKLHQQEIELASQLAKIQQAVTQSLQQLAMLKASKRDFAAVEALRKAYLEAAKSHR